MPPGELVSPVGPGILSAVHIILFNVKYSISPFGHDITSGHHIVQCRVPGEVKFKFKFKNILFGINTKAHTLTNGESETQQGFI